MFRQIALALAVLLALVTPAWAGQNVLSWTDNSSSEQNFEIERKAEACSGSAALTLLATVGINVTTFTDTAVIENATYCYQVRAANASGFSPYSNTAGRQVPFPAPSELVVN